MRSLGPCFAWALCGACGWLVPGLCLACVWSLAPFGLARGALCGVWWACAWPVSRLWCLGACTWCPVGRPVWLACALWGARPLGLVAGLCLASGALWLACAWPVSGLWCLVPGSWLPLGRPVSGLGPGTWKAWPGAWNPGPARGISARCLGSWRGAWKLGAARGNFAWQFVLCLALGICAGCGDPMRARIDADPR